MIIGTYNLPAAVTFTGLWLAMGAGFFTFQGRMEYASICLIWAGVCDLLDGPLARRCKTNKAQAAFGVQIDSLVDLVSFGVIPAVCCLHLGLDTLPDYLLLSLYTSAAAMRLATFNTMKAAGSLAGGTYRGLPVTYAALAFPLAFLTTRFVPQGPAKTVIRLVVFAMAAAFVLDFQVSKPSFRGYLVLLGLALGLSLAFILLA